MRLLSDYQPVFEDSGAGIMKLLNSQLSTDGQFDWSKTGVIALLDFDFLGDFRRFSRRFSQKFRRFFSLNGHNTSIIKYCTMKMNLPNFLPQQDVLLYSCPQLQSRYYIHTMHYPMSEGMSQIIIQF